MPPSQCPTDDRLLAFHQGRISNTCLEEITAHLSGGCLACHVLLEELEGQGDPLRELLRRYPFNPRHVENADSAPTTSPANPGNKLPRVGERVSGYEILAKLGSGGMGVVYKALQLNVNRVVALKMILAGHLASDTAVRRFLAEAKAAAHLDHPNLVPLYDVGAHHGKPYFSMKFVDGGSLARKIAGTPLPPEEAAQLVETLAWGIKYAHEHGVVHRDLKPANVLLTSDGTPLIADFGLAKSVESGKGLTQSGAIIGTPSYMAPEQVAGNAGEIGASTDVYALGAILYECLTGRPPFKGTTSVDTMLQVRTDSPVPVRRLQPTVQRDLETICHHCLSKQSSKRYASARELAEDLRRFLDGRPVQARRVGTLSHAWRWGRRNPLPALLVAGLALTVCVGLGVCGSFWYQAVLSGRETEAARRDAEENEARALANEAQALVNLRNEEAARKEAEDSFAMIRDVLNENVILSNSPFFAQAPNGVPVRIELLLKAEACYASLLRKRGQDPELRTLYAHTLRCLGQITFVKDRSEGLALLEKGARLFEHLPPEGNRDPGYLQEGVLSYLFLGLAHEQVGNRESARQALETAFRLWHALANEQPSVFYQRDAFQIAVHLSTALRTFGHSEADILGRFERGRPRPEASDKGPACDLIRDLLMPVVRWEMKHVAPVQPAESLAVSREVAAVLDRFYQHMPSDRKARLSVIRYSIQVSAPLRKCGALDESINLLKRANREVQKLCREEPTGCYYYHELSRSWFEISKIHWKSQETDDALNASRRALEAQEQALALAPAVRLYREELGLCHVRLGRKFCELGRLDEAEACFQGRQALWPGDIDRHEEALREVRRWAKEVGDGKNLSADEQQERQRYLDLCLRLERQGISAEQLSGAQKP